MKTKTLSCVTLLCLILAVAVSGESEGGNLIVDPGLESDGDLNWHASMTTLTRVKTKPRTGESCLRIQDASGSQGQGNCNLFEAAPGLYYVEVWVRVDPSTAAAGTSVSPFIEGYAGAESGKALGTVMLGVQFFDADKKYQGMRHIGKMSSTDWGRLSGKLTVPQDATYVSLRIMPTGPMPGVAKDKVGRLKGACLVDDLYFARAADAITDGRLKLPKSSATPGAGGAAMVDESLVLHYTFDYPDTFGYPGDQRVVKDHSLYGNDGKIVNNPEALRGWEGRQGVLRFGGQNTYVDCGTDESLYIGGDMTIVMWARLNGLVRNKGNFALIYGDENSANFNFGIQNYEFLRLWYTGEEGSMMVPTGKVLGLEWSHVALVVEYPRCRIYHNGKLVRDAYMPTTGINKHRFARKTLAGWPTKGSGSPIDLDEFRVYSRALSAAEVAAQARNQEIAPNRDDELAVEAHWYEDFVAVRLSCKGSDYRNHVAELSLLGGDYAPVFKPQRVKLTEAFPGCRRYVATAKFPLAGLEGLSLDGLARIFNADGKQVNKLNIHASLKKPDWVHNKEGYSDKPPVPWTPVTSKSNSDGTIEVGVWGRSYLFGKTLFPQKIKSGGEDILTAPITLTGSANGNSIAFDNGKVELASTTDTVATLKQSAENDLASIAIDSMIEFDGYAIFDCHIKAKQDLSIENLMLTIPLKSRYATLCMAMFVYEHKIFMKRNHSGAVNGDLDFRVSPSAWIGNEDRGLCWQVESDEYWHNADPQKAMLVRPRGETTVFQINFIDKQTKLAAGETLHYKFALLATPTKPILRDSWDLRIVRSDPFGEDLNLPDRKIDGKPALQHYVDMGVRHMFSTAEGDPWPYPMPYDKRYAAAVRRMVRTVHDYGIRIYPYAIHERFPIAVKEFDIHGRHIAKYPLLSFQYGGGPPPPHYGGYHGPVATANFSGYLQGTVAFCAKSKAAQDANVYSIAQRLQQYGDDGVYLDGTSFIEEPCKNQLHGCGYVTADGTVKGTYPVFGYREQIKRIYTAVKKRRPNGVVDLHHSFGQNAAALTFADLLWTGEHWHHLKNTGAPDGYISGELPLDMFRAEFMGRPIGVATEVLAYRLMGNQSSVGGRRQVSSIGLLHDVPVRARTQDKAWFGFMSQLWKMRDKFGAHKAEKLFYWDNQDYVTVSPDKCYATLFKHPTNGVLVLVSNLSREEQKTIAVKLNLDALSLAGKKMDVFNPLTDQAIEMSADGAFTVSLRSEDWNYIWLRPAK